MRSRSSEVETPGVRRVGMNLPNHVNFEGVREKNIEAYLEPLQMRTHHHGPPTRKGARRAQRSQCSISRGKLGREPMGSQE